MSDNIIHLNDVIAFEETVINSADPVLVDFWAEWCGPCKMIAPLLDEIADEFLGKITIAKVDVDAIPEISEKYGIRGIPTLILFKADPTTAQKVCAATKVGAVSKKQLKAFIDDNLD